MYSTMEEYFRVVLLALLCCRGQRLHLYDGPAGNEYDGVAMSEGDVKYVCLSGLQVSQWAAKTILGTMSFAVEIRSIYAPVESANAMETAPRLNISQTADVQFSFASGCDWHI